MNEDLDQMFTSAQAAMAFALANWPAFELWLFGMFGRMPVDFETLRTQALAIDALIDGNRLPQ